MRPNSVNQIFNPNVFVSLLRGATSYYNAIYILLTYFASFIGYADHITLLKLFLICTFKKPNLADIFFKFAIKSYKMLNSAEFMEFVFSKSGLVGVGVKWVYRAVRYETLQDCASISVSILCNFPLPCLVNFMNNLVFCFSPKYLGLPVLTKYFVKNYLFLSWGRPQFSLFYPNFSPLLHLQYMKIHKKSISTKLSIW